MTGHNSIIFIDMFGKYKQSFTRIPVFYARHCITSRTSLHYSEGEIPLSNLISVRTIQSEPPPIVAPEFVGVADKSMLNDKLNCGTFWNPVRITQVECAHGKCEPNSAVICNNIQGCDLRGTDKSSQSRG